jgi:hypothetical protein
VVLQTSYADDYNAEIVDLPYAWVLDRYWEEVEASAANAPMALCPGNHEDQYAFAAHLNRTRMPSPTLNGEPVRGPLARFYYSFDYGCVHFLSISTEHDSSTGSEQWTVRHLARSCGRKKPSPPHPRWQGEENGAESGCVTTSRPPVLQFVQQDLEAANRNRALVPWIVFFTHHPFYCSTQTEPGACPQKECARHTHT